ncbi:MAG: hypothetical protein KKC37_12205, partial [Proteobacteria bacterium]|nr:hypothetical protein [Pseudomonadota bacterium]
VSEIPDAAPTDDPLAEVLALFPGARIIPEADGPKARPQGGQAEGPTDRLVRCADCEHGQDRTTPHGRGQCLETGDWYWGMKPRYCSTFTAAGTAEAA